MKIKKGDMFVVISGDEAATTPRRVSEVLDAGHPKSPSGGRLRFEKPIFASNVMFYCEACKRPVRVGFRFTADGAKERFCKKCNVSAGKVSPARG